MKQTLDLSLLNSTKIETWGKDKLTIRGGQLEDEPQAVEDLLNAWQLPSESTPWVLAEWVHNMELLSSEAWQCHADRLKHHLLERVRIFGRGGDFELRRDENCLSWRWVGPTPAPEINNELLAGVDFWRPETSGLLRVDIEHLLWGKLDTKRGVWLDDRVAREPLRYPIEAESGSNERVIIHGSQFIAGGAPQFVWWQQIEGWQNEEG